MLPPLFDNMVGFGGDLRFCNGDVLCVSPWIPASAGMTEWVVGMTRGQYKKPGSYEPGFLYQDDYCVVARPNMTVCSPNTPGATWYFGK